MINIKDLPMAGSDEVGNGDSFGPFVVACALVEEKDIDLINNLGIKDSKQITDKKIKEIGDVLTKKIKHSFVILKNKAYNKATEKFNQNEIKATLHNACYINLRQKYKLPNLCVVDQFCTKEKFYEYLENNKDILEIQYGLSFETKAENKYIAVAVASVIARYYFIKEFEELCKKYDMELSKGSANPIIDDQLKEIIKRYGKEELNNVAKLHFKNVAKHYK